MNSDLDQFDLNEQRKFTFLDETISHSDDPNKAIDISIRLQNVGNKKITIIEGIDNLEQCHSLKVSLKKSLSTGGTVKKTPENSNVILLQGDRRNDVKEFLIKKGGFLHTMIKVHGG